MFQHALKLVVALSAWGLLAGTAQAAEVHLSLSNISLTETGLDHGPKLHAGNSLQVINPRSQLRLVSTADDGLSPQTQDQTVNSWLTALSSVSMAGMTLASATSTDNSVSINGIAGAPGQSFSAALALSTTGWLDARTKLVFAGDFSETLVLSDLPGEMAHSEHEMYAGFIDLPTSTQAAGAPLWVYDYHDDGRTITVSRSAHLELVLTNEDTQARYIDHLGFGASINGTSGFGLPTPVPEPESYALMLLGLVGVAVRRRAKA